MAVGVFVGWRVAVGGGVVETAVTVFVGTAVSVFIFVGKAVMCVRAGWVGTAVSIGSWLFPHAAIINAKIVRISKLRIAAHSKLTAWLSQKSC